MADKPRPSIEAPSRALGSTWIHLYEGCLWPVVICDRSTVPEFFFKLRSKEYHIPAILLGKHIYVWVTDATVQEYNPNYDYASECEAFEHRDVPKSDDEDTRTERLRRMAFEIEAPHLRDNEYWHNYIISESNVRSLERKMKRPHSTDDDEIEIVGAERQSNTSSFSSGLPHSRVKKTTRSNHAQSRHIIEITDHEESDDDDVSFLTDFTSKPDCRILLGGHGQSIIASRARCAESDYLQARERYDEAVGEHIIDLNDDQRAVELDLAHVELQRIEIFLSSGDVGPQFLKDPDEYRPFGKLSEEEKENAAHQLALAFVTASKLQHVKLQGLIEKKLNALYPLPAMSLLTVALILARMPPTGIMTHPEQRVGNWLIASLAGQFWHLAKHHTGTFQRLLQGNDELRDGVYHRMQMNADEGLQGGEEL
ncbi:hypothetical protein DOTSEDRAFT_134513 [Dothistroma septosporum NZE10]|uniref:PWWP domain-containing protein n=1 Tax=Dothistroma septosporum (strain NZE10 / CBS 128990) TaxID=675120 RepID=N1PFL4_DOTSN|nr:hypothetical protein DOTSEDRAFT_134513 [Dothistroma septosporum NZE10]